MILLRAGITAIWATVTLTCLALADGLSGGVDCGTSAQWVSSPGLAEYRNTWGNIDTSVTLSGQHAIVNVTTGFSSGAGYSVGGQYGQTISMQGNYGSCYRGTLSATASGLFVNESNSFGSATACTEPPAPPPPGVPVTECDGSPILLDLDASGFHLAGAADAVSFDIIPGGVPERVSWTQAGEADGFLVLDRNSNGIIDDGGELFGNHTRLSNGQTVPYGFVPLAEFDSPSLGGNGNWVIDGGDAIFPQLKIWIDANHNGFSETNELSTLEAWGIRLIEVDYRVSWRRDQHGNLFRSASRVWLSNAAGKERSRPAYDVFFVYGN